MTQYLSLWMSQISELQVNALHWGCPGHKLQVLHFTFCLYIQLPLTKSINFQLSKTVSVDIKAQCIEISLFTSTQIVRGDHANVWSIQLRNKVFICRLLRRPPSFFTALKDKSQEMHEWNYTGGHGGLAESAVAVITVDHRRHISSLQAGCNIFSPVVRLSAP